AREINAQEQPSGSATFQGGELVTSFSAYQPRSFAVKLGTSAKRASAPQFASVKLPYDVSVASLEDKPASGCFDCSFDRPTAPQGKALPAEMMPSKIDYAGVRFALAPAAAGEPNAVTTNGQTIDLPAGKFNRLYLLAAAANGDQKTAFKIG